MLSAPRLDPVPVLLAGALMLGLGVQAILPPPAPSGVSTAHPWVERASAVRAASVAPAPPPIPAYPATSDRPLFVSSRSAVMNGTAQGAASGALSLLGVAASGARAAAVLRDSAGQVRAVSLGDAVDGWRLAAVGAEGAVLRRGEVVQTLRVGAPASPVGVSAPVPAAGPQAVPR